MIQFENLALRRGELILFEKGDLQINVQQKIGLTGANGCGKSSLFSLLMGKLSCDEGSVKIPNDWTLAHISQEAPSDEKSALDHALDGDQEWRFLNEKIEDNSQENTDFQDRYEAIGGYSTKSKACEILHGLGFSQSDFEKPAIEFSGGWRVKINLAKALVCRSDLLLLDEPTNHLDLTAVLWLEKWLKNYKGTIITIAHDRDFLDALTTHTIEIENQRMILYKGNYSIFERTKAQQLALQQSNFHKQEKKIEDMTRFVERFRAKASKSRQAQSRLKALEKMNHVAPAHAQSLLEFTIPQPLNNPSPLFTLNNVSIGYNEIPILKGINLSLSAGDRIGLIGENGAGKSTLVKLIAKQIMPISGHIYKSNKLNIGYFAQHQIEQLSPDQSPLEHLQLLANDASFKDQTENQLRRYLGSYGFTKSKTTSPVGPFSGGEKSRLALALLCFKRPNLLLLDEPTNHLDIDMRRALSEAIQAYTGAVVLVSHDRHLLKLNCDKLLLIAEGYVSLFDGNIEDYPKWMAAQHKIVSDRNKHMTGMPEEGTRHSGDKKERKRLEALLRAKLSPIKQKMNLLETELEKVNIELNEIEQRLSEPDVYFDDHKAELKELLAQQLGLSKRQNNTEENWLETCQTHEELFTELQSELLAD